jgi:tetratricopeptide (TPR) repeat protein
MKKSTKAWDKNKVALRQDEMCYIACILMARAHGFMGDHQKAMENFNLAEQFSPGRNEHYMYLCYYLEEKNMLEDVQKSYRKNSRVCIIVGKNMPLMQLETCT